MRAKSRLTARFDPARLLTTRFDALQLGRPRRAKLKRAIAALHRELAVRDIRLEPHVWFADEWFSPDGIPGIAIPFYLAHAHLERLERRMSGYVEGGNEASLMRILRHEAGHAVDTAFRLRRRKIWRATFGSPRAHYPSSYTARIGSREFVHHLDDWYAQAHPAEDFAETFAVWLAPGARWRSRYRGTPALAKLEVMDALMQSVRGRVPPVRAAHRIDSVASSRRTLGQHYESMRRRRSRRDYSLLARHLAKVFVVARQVDREREAATWLQRHRGTLVARAVRETDLDAYSARQLLEACIEWCRDHRLQWVGAERRIAGEAGRGFVKLAQAGCRGGKLRFPL